MKILLISANPVTTPYPVYPLGLDYVAGAIAAPHVVEILDVLQYDLQHEAQSGISSGVPFGIGGQAPRLQAKLAELAPDLIGISIRNIDNTDHADSQDYIAWYQKLVEWLRQHSTALLVGGGSGFSIFPEQLRHLLNLDYGIVGEGERLGQLVEVLAAGGSPESIPGVVSAHAGLQWPRSDLPLIARPFNPQLPHVAYYLKHGGILNLQTKRGCPFECIYCTYPHIEGRSLRLRPPMEVAREALALQEAGARYFFITDAAFNAAIEHSLEVAHCFMEVGVRIPWGAYFVPLAPPAGYFQTLVRAGLTHVEFGTESLSDTVLLAYGKPYKVQHVLTAHAEALKAGCHIAHFMLAGGPEETAATLEETLAYVDNLPRCVLFFFCGMRIYPYTRLRARLQQQGQLSPDQDLLGPCFYQPEHLSLTTIEATIQARAKHRKHWIIGSGGDLAATAVQKLYRRGYSGPLWEFLIDRL